MKFKRTISGFVAASLAAGMITGVFAADETPTITLNGGDVTGKPITLTVTGGEAQTIKWQRSDNGTDGFSDITLNSKVDTDTSYWIKPKTSGDEGKYIRAEVVIDGTTYYSDVKGPLPKSAGPKLNDSAALEGVTETPDADWVFKPADTQNTVDGKDQTFTLLETKNAATDGLFVFTNDSYGGCAFDTSGSQKFDVNSETNIAYKLKDLANGQWTVDWWGNSKTIKFPTSFVNSLKEHEWFIEAGHADGDAPADRTVKTKLALLSHAEWKEYYKKIGYKHNPQRSNHFALRTPSGISADSVMRVSWYDGGRALNMEATYTNDARPCFYIDGDYFKNYKIDVATAGTEVKKYITSTYTSAELKTSAEYTDTELENLGYNLGLAKVSGVSLNKVDATGKPVTVNYTPGENCVDVKIRWYISSAENGTYSEITLIDGVDEQNAYMIKPSDKNKYLMCKVSPINSEGVEGAAVSSDIFGPLPESRGPHNNGAGWIKTNETADADWLFSPADDTAKSFILLDKTSGATDGLYVMANNTYGGRKNAETADNVRFEMKEGNIAYALNNELYANGKWSAYTIGGQNQKEYTFPASLKAYINEHEWLTDAGNSASNAPADYITKAYLAIPSYYEWNLYKDKLGYKISGAQFDCYSLRNGSNSGANTVHCISSKKDDNGDFYVWAINGAPNRVRDIRPCFYLKPEYFLKNKIDVATAGAEVKKYIVETYSDYNELKNNAGYTNSELYGLGYDIEGLLTVSDVKISEPATQYDTVNVTYTWNNADAGEYGTTFEWYISASKTGPFEKVDIGDESQSYTIRPKDGGKYLKCVVTPADADESEAAEGESNVVGPLPKSLGPVSVQSEIFEDQPADTPAENIFKVSGFDNEFILLDTEGTGTSKFFVLEKTHYELRKFNTETISAKFDPNDAGSIANYLNSDDFFTNGWNEYAKHKIPSVVLSYIDGTHTWETEAGYPTTDISCDYKVTCGVSLLSYGEWKKYHSKIGYDDGLKHGWMLRTSRGDIEECANTILYIYTDADAESLNQTSYKGRAMQTPVNLAKYFRPCFWLNDNFFEKVKLDVSSMGSNVKAYLTETYTAAQMKTVGYSDAELLEIGFAGENQILDVTDSEGNAITAANVSSITGMKYKFSAKEAVTADVVAAFYTADGKLAGLKIEENVSFVKGYNAKTITLENAVDGAASMKLMLWDSLDAMKPICESYGLPAQTYEYDEYLKDAITLNTPEEYIFTLASGDKYILLGESDKLFVMDYNSAGETAFDESGTQKFDTNDTDNIGYKLNNDYLNNLILKDYIENNHTWETEKGADDGNCTTVYSFNAAVALLSYSEWITYKSRIGSKDGLSGNWWLRTPRGINAESNHGFVVNIGDGGAIIKNNTDEQALARPVFYLSKDFVKEIKLDAEKTGSALKKIIMKRFSAEELYLSGYSEAELRNIGYSVNSEASVKSAAIKDADKTGLPARVEYEIDGIYSEIKTEWQLSFMKNGTYTAATDDELDTNKNEYYIKPNDKNKYLRCKITPVGIDGEDREAYVTESVGPLPKSLGALGGDLDGALSGITEKTSDENIFCIDGEKFILLDIEENGDVIVLAENSYGDKAYAADSKLKFDPKNENNIAYFLNNDFLSKGIECYKLPQKIIDNLSRSHKWICEGGNSNTDVYADYNVTCPVALLSYTEWVKYHDIIGYDDGSTEGWFLRTPRGDKSYITDCVLMVRAGAIYEESGERGCASGMPISRKEGIRPVIALDKNFFVNVHADNVGSEAAKKIKAVYSAEELANGAANWQNHELRAMGYEVEGIDEIAKITFDGAPFYVQNQNEAGFTLEMNITGDTAQSYTVTYESDKGGDTEVINVTPDETFTKKYLVAADCGITSVSVKVERADRVIAEKTMQLAIVKKYETQFMEKASRAVMAAHMTFSSGNTDPRELDLMKQIGVQKVRDELYWGTVEREKGVYSFDKTDVPMGEFSDAGLEARINLTYNNLLYVTAPEGVSDQSKVAPRTYEELSAFCEYAKQLVLKYPQINTVEVWNEPNWYVFWEPEVNMIDYATMVKAVSAAIHEVRPEVNVVAGSFVYGHTGRTDFEDSAGEFLAEGAMDYADGISTHPYYYPGSVDRLDTVFYKKSNTLFDSYGILSGRYSTEVGLTTSDRDNGVTEEVQADALAKTFVYSDAAGVKETTWYNFRDKGLNPSDNEHNFGIIKRNFLPKPALIALNQSNRVLNGAVYIGKISFDSEVTGYIYLKDAKPICIIWSTGEGTLHVSMENSYVEDINGNVLPESDMVDADSNIKYVYGIADRFLVQAAKNTYAENYTALTEKVSVPPLAQVFELAKVQNIKGAGNYLVNSYKNGDIDAEEMRFCLSKLAKMLEAVSLLGAYNGGTTSAETVSETKPAESKVNSNALFKMYKEYKKLLETAEAEADCDAKTLAVSAYKNISSTILGWVNKLSEIEEDDSGYGIIIYTDEGNYKESGNMKITVQNTESSAIDNASIKLYNDSEDLLSEGIVSISAKSAATEELAFELTGLNAGKYKWKIVLEKDGETITSRGIYVTVE